MVPIFDWIFRLFFLELIRNSGRWLFDIIFHAKHSLVEETYRWGGGRRVAAAAHELQLVDCDQATSYSSRFATSSRAADRDRRLQQGLPVAIRACSTRCKILSATPAPLKNLKAGGLGRLELDS